jgi:hypothetical protein
VTWKLDSATNDLAAAVRKVGADIGDTEPVKRPRHSLEVLGLFDRCRSLFAATHLLLTHRFVHEAVMLGRPLFTDSLMLTEYASANETQRVELVMGWSIASLAAVEGIFLDARRSRGKDVAAALTGLAERRREYEEYARRQGVERLRAWQPDDHAKRLASKHGREDEYGALLVTQQFVHGSTSAVSTRVSKIAEDTVEVGGSAVDLESWGRAAALFGANSMLHAARAGCGIFGWQEPPKVEELFQRVKQASDDLG